MKGSANSMVTNMARIFGTNTSVCSWIWVSACTSETATPTTRPTTIIGDDTSTMVQIASRATSRVSAPVIWIPQSSGRAAKKSAESNRHLHDVLVGLDDAV